MKKICVLILALWLTAVCASSGWTGTLTDNQFLYKPSLGARGAAEKNTFEAGLDRVDARLAKEIWLGDPKYGATLPDAVTALGATPAILRLPAGTQNISANLTIPATLTLKLERGAVLNVADTKTLTINGGFEAGLYPCFTWAGTGKVVFGQGTVKAISPQWFGAVSGTGSDCQAALSAAVTAMPTGAKLVITDGVWRVASTWTVLKPITLEGVGVNSQIYIDVGTSNDGVVFGDVNTSRSGLRIKNISFTGPANACRNGVVFNRFHKSSVDAFFCMGASNYGAVIQGCCYFDGVVKPIYEGVSTGNRPANGVWVTSSYGTPTYQSNVVNLLVYSEITAGGGVDLGDGITNRDNVKLTGGAIEYATGAYVLRARKVYGLTLGNLYLQDGNTGKLSLQDCLEVDVSGLRAYQTAAELLNCQRVTIRDSQFNNFSVDSNCRSVVLENLGIHGTFSDAAPDTQYKGKVRSLDGVQAIFNRRAGTGDQINYLSNTNFRRWQSDRPDGWGKTGATTWSQCGDGLSDTTRRGTTYCAKSAISADTSNAYTLEADAVKDLQGQTCHFSAWVYHASGQNPRIYPNFRMRVVAGGNTDYYSYYTTPLSAGTDDAWTRVNIGFEVPANATDVQISLWQYVPTGGGTDTLYISEPCLWANAGAPSSYVPGCSDHGDYLTIGSQKITFGTAAPGTGWWNRGDIRFNSAATVGQPKGWQCTVSGTPGTWVSMGNL
jgi:hypothetical protein